MPRTGELTYFQAIGDAGREHALRKPFSDESCGVSLMQVGALMSLLPPPPARVLECGCGTGWFSYMLQRRGYEVVGVDVCADAIALTEANPLFPDEKRPTFQVADVEKLSFRDEFDAVVFFESLHHAVDEKAALESAFRALKPGGVCLVSEPGVGHHKRSREIIEQYDVTEKDMPPRLVIRHARAIGFRKWRTFPRADHLGRFLFQPRWQALGRLSGLLRWGPMRFLAAVLSMSVLKRYYGTVMLWK